MVDIRLAAFSEDATSALRFLAEEFGFTGPDLQEDGYVGFTSGPWSVWAVLEVRNKTVDTYVRHDLDGRSRHDSVWKLARKTKVRGAGQSRTSAHKRAGVQASLKAQANALRLVLPHLLDDGAQLLD